MPATHGTPAATTRNRLTTALAAILTLGLAACSGGDTDTAAAIPRSPVERCVTVANAMQPGPVPGTWTQAVTQSDLQSVASAGFDTVRLTVPLAEFTAPEPPFDMDEAALDRLSAVIDWALGANLQVIITLSDFGALEADVSTESGRLNRAWIQVAEHLKPIRRGLIFELIDAPSDALTGKAMDDLNAAILKQVRDVDSRRWVILASGDGNSLRALEAAAPPADPRTILSLHYTDPAEFTAPDPGAAAQAEWGSMDEFRAVLTDFERADAVRNRVRQPVLVGEFGVDSAVPVVMRARWIRAVRRQAEANGMGWCYAAFGGEDGVFDLETGRWSPELVTALFRDPDRLN